MAEDIDLRAIAHDTHGYSGGDLSQLVLEAGLAAVRGLATRPAAGGGMLLVVEFCDGGSVESLLRRRAGKPLGAGTARGIARQVGGGPASDQ